MDTHDGLLLGRTSIITTEGDPLSDLVKQNQLGLTVPCGDTEALAHAILRAADDQATRQTWKLNCLARQQSFLYGPQYLNPSSPGVVHRSRHEIKNTRTYGIPLVGDSGSWPKHAWEYYLQRALHHYRVTGMKVSRLVSFHGRVEDDGRGHEWRLPMCRWQASRCKMFPPWLNLALTVPSSR